MTATRAGVGLPGGVGRERSLFNARRRLNEAGAVGLGLKTLRGRTPRVSRIRDLPIGDRQNRRIWDLSHAKQATEALPLIGFVQRATGVGGRREPGCYEDSYRPCYVRSAKGIIVELTEQIG
jgi:hypothetical protein